MGFCQELVKELNKTFSSMAGGNTKNPNSYNFLKFQSQHLAGDDILEMRFDSMFDSMHWLLASFWLPKETEMQILILNFITVFLKYWTHRGLSRLVF